jgi:hypothetical protein
VTADEVVRHFATPPLWTERDGRAVNAGGYGWPPDVVREQRIRDLELLLREAD